MATKFVGCDIYYYDPYKATITLTTTHFFKKDGFKLDKPFSEPKEFIDGQKNKNTKKKTKRYVAVFHEFLVLKGGTRQIN